MVATLVGELGSCLVVEMVARKVLERVEMTDSLMVLKPVAKKDFLKADLMVVWRVFWMAETLAA